MPEVIGSKQQSGKARPQEAMTRGAAILPQADGCGVMFLRCGRDSEQVSFLADVGATESLKKWEAFLIDTFRGKVCTFANFGECNLRLAEI